MECKVPSAGRIEVALSLMWFSTKNLIQLINYMKNGIWIMNNEQEGESKVCSK